jgi:hypothetical protein
MYFRKVTGCYTLKNKKRGKSIVRPPRSPDLTSLHATNSKMQDALLPGIRGEQKPQFSHNMGQSPPETYVRT